MVELGRRAFVVRVARAAGLAAPLVQILEGGASAEEGARLLPGGEATDMAILHGALQLEHHAIGLYTHGLSRGLFPRGLRAYATEFRGDHQGHRDTQIAIVEERGGRAPEPRTDQDFGRAPAGDDFVRLALEIEVAAQRAYTALISQIRTKDYLLSAAFILVDEVRHMIVWRRVLGLPIY